MQGVHVVYSTIEIIGQWPCIVILRCKIAEGEERLNRGNDYPYREAVVFIRLRHTHDHNNSTTRRLSKPSMQLALILDDMKDQEKRAPDVHAYDWVFHQPSTKPGGCWITSDKTPCDHRLKRCVRNRIRSRDNEFKVGHVVLKKINIGL